MLSTLPVWVRTFELSALESSRRRSCCYRRWMVFYTACLYMQT